MKKAAITVLQKYLNMIEKEMKRVLLYAEPRFILINPKVFHILRVKYPPLRDLTFNGGNVAYSLTVDLNEVPREDWDWQPKLSNAYHMEFVISNSVKNILVVGDPGNEYERLKGRLY